MEYVGHAKRFSWPHLNFKIAGCWSTSMSTMETWSSGFMELCVTMDISLGKPVLRFSLEQQKRKSNSLCSFDAKVLFSLNEICLLQSCLFTRGH